MSCSIDHDLAIFFRHRHELFAEHMHPILGSKHRVFAMQMVGQYDINRIDGKKSFLVIVIRIDLLHAIFPGHFLPFVGVAGNNGNQLRVLRLLECG